MRNRRLLALVLVAMIAAGCGRPGTPARSSDDGSPAWYGQRAGLPSCGIDAEHTRGYPNVPARDCFRTAYASGTPAELTRVTYGDEGESIRAHFRIVGPGAYEIVGEEIPSPHGPWPDAGGWVRYACDHFVFMDEPGAETNGAPWVNGEGECELVDRQAG